MKKTPTTKSPALVLFAITTFFVAILGRASDQPNFLIIMADDCTYNDLPVYGGLNAQTPNIDALAKRGLVFNQSYLCSSMCQPCRAELYTGQYPLTNGCCWNHSASRPETKSLPHYLRPLGYRVGLAGKVHVKPAKAFPFDSVKGFDSNCVRDKTQPHDLQPLKEYMNTQKQGSPFCLVVALVEPHIPWSMGDASQYPPKKIQLPPNIADTPSTRQHFSSYLAEITYMDDQVGQILKTLESSGAKENTLVLFTSEQGSQFPGCKWTNWNTGVHTAMIASWPGKAPSGKRTNALIQYADIAPTLLAIAGGKKSGNFNGSSFANVLTGKTNQHRKYAYSMHNNLPEGPRYPVRSVTDGKHRYIRNLVSKEIYIEKHLMGGGRLNNPYWATWVGADPIRQPKTYELVKRYMRRPKEQLYDSLRDPYEMTNLANREIALKTKQDLGQALDAWMKSENDPGANVDTVEALQAARNGKHLHGQTTKPDQP